MKQRRKKKFRICYSTRIFGLKIQKECSGTRRRWYNLTPRFTMKKLNPNNFFKMYKLTDDGLNKSKKKKSKNSSNGDVVPPGANGVYRQKSFGSYDRRINAISSYMKTACSINPNSRSTGKVWFTRKMAVISIGCDPWPSGEDNYELLDVIGVGATAVVHGAICKPKNEKCAIKRINLEKWNTSMEELLKEIHAMSNCNHENVVTYYTSFVVNDELWLVMKLLEGGSLLDVIKHKMKVSNCKHGVFDEATIATVLREVLKGLEYFHNNGQIHRDIKAGNILLGEDGTVQIADFGVSAWLATGKDMSRQRVRHTFVGTPCWMAPEVMEQDHGYDYKADIWSFGITAIEMATGAAPYHKYPPMKVLMLTLQNDPPNLDTGAEKDQYKIYGKTFRKLIYDSLQKDPSKRPTATELLKHPFFKKAKDKKYLAQTLIDTSATLEARVHKVNKKQATPGRLNRTLTGDWEWSDDEVEEAEEAYLVVEGEEAAGRAHPSSEDELPDEDKPMNQLQKGDSSGSDAEEAGPSTSQNSTHPREQPVVNLMLRIRNAHGELNDIRFHFVKGKDTSEGIALELVGAGLIEPQDAILITLHLEQLINAQSSNAQMPYKTITFHLNSAAPNADFNDNALDGFAQISVL
ncbi:PREDICTED: serine/threonine-protein kinase OSR1-like isoform X2 [Papilio xuthus]|uniref:non-specific serine/threonine protein kinase n=2 Tax=Papilio xuthus TaxID=66420 RepID=A0AAJ6ZUN4_PAPXU|nr:PREDICTED: serine/threonine-protein kinase OSR1-like isoform X2 [Papilio xuthus]